MPQVSVLMPVFNAEETVLRAIRSILEQSFTELQLIVVDDGSTDQSADRVASIHDDRLVLIRENHHGVAHAANTALRHADAPLIARMDADDVAANDRIQKQRDLLLHRNLDVVGSQVRITTLSGQAVPEMGRYERWINVETLQHDQIMALRFVEFPLVNPTLLARRKYFEFQFSQNSYPEDYELMLKAASAGMKFGKVEEPLLTWTESPHRLTRSDARYTPDAFMACRRHFLLRDVLAGVKTVDVWGAGRTGKLWLRWLHDNNISVRRIIDVGPITVGRTIRNSPVIHCDDMPDYDGTLLISAVGAMGARELIEDHAAQRGYRSGDNLWFVA